MKLPQIFSNTTKSLFSNPGDKASIEVTSTGRTVKKYTSGDGKLKFGTIEYPNSNKITKYITREK